MCGQRFVQVSDVYQSCLQFFNFVHHGPLTGHEWLYFPTAAKKSRVVSDADDSDSDVVSDKSGKREKTVASDSEEEAGKEESSVKKKEEKDLFGSDSESGNEEE